MGVVLLADVRGWTWNDKKTGFGTGTGWSKILDHSRAISIRPFLAKTNVGGSFLPFRVLALRHDVRGDTELGCLYNATHGKVTKG